MDILLVGSLGVISIFVLIVVAFIVKLRRDEGQQADRVAQLMAVAGPRPAQAAPRVVGGRRAGGAARRRGGRRRDSDEDLEEEEPVRGGAGRAVNPWGESEEEEGGDGSEFGLDGKVGKKKLAKLQAKEEKRATRAAELAEREDQKAQDKVDASRRQKEADAEAAEEAAEAERRRLEKEEKEREEQEAYEAMKADFAVDEEGFDEDESLDNTNLLEEFISYIKRMKVVNMDELAGRFKLKTPEVVERLRGLVSDGTLSGVIDDRGKFIYISAEELGGVAKFVNQRGRVSIAELADYSNKLIRLEPEPTPS